MALLSEKYPNAKLFNLTQIKEDDARPIIGRYLSLKYKGDYAVGLCPFHNERTASFYAYKNGFNCFGCGANGDVIDFVMKIENITFVQAVGKLGGAEEIDVIRAQQIKDRAEVARIAAEFTRRKLYPQEALEHDWQGVQEAARPVQLREIRSLRDDHELLAVEDASAEDPIEEPEQWLVPGVLPLGAVCLFSGGEGLGKSYILLDLMVAAGLPNATWLGERVAPVKSFAWFCEDPPRMLRERRTRSLHTRLAAPADLEDRVSYSSRYGRDSWLLAHNDRTDMVEPTKLWHLLQSHGYLDGVQLLVLDTAMDAITGDVNRSRVAVTTILFLTKWAVENNACVILTIHPTKDRTSEYGGAKQWRSKSRVHLHLSRPQIYDKDKREWIWEGLSGDRWLTVSKANYGEQNKKIPIRWDRDDKIFVLDEYRVPLWRGGGS